MPRRSNGPKTASNPKKNQKKVLAELVEQAQDKEESNQEFDDTAQLLKQAADLMQKAATSKSQRGELLSAAEDALSKLRIVDFPDLAESPVVANFLKAMGMEGMRPGEIKNRGTLAERARDWSWRDVNEMPKIKFTPAETIDITFNGLALRVQEDMECEVPRPFYDIYVEHRRALQQARLNESYLLGYSDVPPHPNWQTPEGARVRANSIQGRAFGRRGGHIGVGPLIEGEGRASE